MDKRLYVELPPFTGRNVPIVKYGRKLDISMERQKSREKKKPLRNTRTTSQSF